MSRPVVFLHGWGLHGGIWDHTVATLPGLSCLTPDLPGYGSTPPVAPYRPVPLATQLAATHPAPCLVVGWSMGGMAAMAWAAQHPEQVKALVLVSTNPVFMRRADWPAGIEPSVLQGFADALRQDYQATLQRFLSLQARGGDDARAVIASLRSSVLARPPASIETLADGLDLLRDVDLRPEIKRIACPTLIVHGAYDGLCPIAAAEWLYQALPDARLAVHPKAAHAPFLSHPDWFADTLRPFLDEHAA